MQTHADVARLHITTADDEHRMHFGRLRVSDLGFDRFGTEIAGHADFSGAELLRDVFGVGDEIVVGVEREDADLFGREPEREVTGVMFDQETDEPFVRAERRAMNAQRRFLGIIFVAIFQAEVLADGHQRARRNPPGWSQS